MLPKSVREKIEEQYGEEILYSEQCGVLAQKIKEETNMRVGKTTVQRWFGFTTDHKRNLQRHTLRTVAVYCGYKSWDLLLADLGGDSVDISHYSDIEELYSDELNPGTQIKLTWEPGRMLLMTYLSDNQYIVNEVVGSRNLQIGDKLTIPHMAIGFPMLVSEVLRDGQEPKSYQAALIGGLTSIVEIVPEN